jgi:hypothetical protein
MARNISQRLSQLQRRRRGTDSLHRLNEGQQAELLLKSFRTEDWQKRAREGSYTRYAVGAMEPVDATYTRVSLETAERVGKQLNAGLGAAGYSVEFRLQGSVPLDVHIRGVSDVDLLTLDTSFFTYHPLGLQAQAGNYSPTSRTSFEVLNSLRGMAEKILRGAYPAAEVDTSGSKAIMISGGSLARPVDVVASHWYNTAAYQASGQEHDRAVTILDKKAQQTLDNWPFMHIKRVHERDTLTLGGLKKAIRLCKNVKSDAEDDGTIIQLPSFDIAATMYHANLSALISIAGFELALLAETQRHLDFLTMNEDEAQKLVVPDGSRKIFDSRAKLNGLRSLSLEMDDLVREVAKEQDYLLALIAQPNLQASREAISKAHVAAA